MAFQAGRSVPQSSLQPTWGAANAPLANSFGQSRRPLSAEAALDQSRARFCALRSTVLRAPHTEVELRDTPKSEHAAPCHRTRRRDSVNEGRRADMRARRGDMQGGWQGAVRAQNAALATSRSMRAGPHKLAGGSCASSSGQNPGGWHCQTGTSGAQKSVGRLPSCIGRARTAGAGRACSSRANRARHPRPSLDRAQAHCQASVCRRHGPPYELRSATATDLKSWRWA